MNAGDARRPEQILDDLYAVIEQRRSADPSQSHTAKLFAGGTGHIGKKVGEEAVEVVIAALDGGKEDLVNESADLLYHLLVLWAENGVVPADVWQALASRTGVSGIEEKRNRKS